MVRVLKGSKSNLVILAVVTYHTLGTPNPPRPPEESL